MRLVLTFLEFSVDIDTFNEFPDTTYVQPIELILLLKWMHTNH